MLRTLRLSKDDRRPENGSRQTMATTPFGTAMEIRGETATIVINS